MTREHLMQSIVTSMDIQEARKKLFSALEKLKLETPNINICYVIGSITSDGPEKIESNLILLKKRSEKVNKEFDGVAFSAADLFNDVLFQRFDSSGATNQDYLDFWEFFIKSGYITHIVRTPGWEKSNGASQENQWASEMGLNITDY